jgi:hypothetical protein
MQHTAHTTYSADLVMVMGRQQRNFDEAVQCKMHAAALICEFLTKQNGKTEGIPATNAAFAPVSPNIPHETGLPNISIDTGVPRPRSSV